jgi:hypothetical protein
MKINLWLMSNEYKHILIDYGLPQSPNERSILHLLRSIYLLRSRMLEYTVHCGS